jgi:hypothetical protein
MTKELQEAKRKRYIENAVSNWNDKLNGVYKYWEKQRYTKDFCLEQIEYFKNFK